MPEVLRSNRSFDSTWEEDETAPPDDVFVCKCGNSWLELVYVEQFLRDTQVTLGQRPVRKYNFGFYLMRCPRCMELYEPSISHNYRDAVYKSYMSFLDRLEKPLPNSLRREAISKMDTIGEDL